MSLRDTSRPPVYPVCMRPPRPPLGLVASALVLLAACSSSAGPSIPPAAGSSAAGALPPGGAATCPTAPAPNPPDPDGWPATGTAVKASVYPLIVSSEQICGRNRLLFSFLDASNRPAAAPDRSATIAIYNLGRDPSTPTATAPATFLWAIEGERGLYVATVDFAEAGEWGAEFTTTLAGGTPEKIRIRFEVKPTGSPVPIGAKAPADRTPTAADVSGDLARLSSDQHPEPSFYQLSIDQAIAEHRPFVLAFATPAFCTSGQCGPTLEILKQVARQEPGFTFINVEPYKLEDANGRLQPVLDANGQLQPVQATIDYGLVSEPWIFIVDADGKIAASFEAIVSPTELTAAIEALKR